MILDLMPADTPEHMRDAWLCCLSWAIGEPDIVATFRKDTGKNWIPGRSWIERAVDSATGVERDFIESFVRWFNVNIWGPME